MFTFITDFLVMLFICSLSTKNQHSFIIEHKIPLSNMTREILILDLVMSRIKALEYAPLGLQE